MPRIWSTEVAAHAGSQVELAGWLHRFRQLSNVSFLILRDGQGLSQVVLEDPKQVAAIAELPNETVIRVSGIATAEAAAPGGVELRNPSIEVLSVPTRHPPFDLFRPAVKAQLPTILDNAAVALRHPRLRARTGALGGASGGPSEHPRNDAVSARHQPSNPVAAFTRHAPCVVL